MMLAEFYCATIKGRFSICAAVTTASAWSRQQLHTLVSDGPVACPCIVEAEGSRDAMKYSSVTRGWNLR